MSLATKSVIEVPLTSITVSKANKRTVYDDEAVEGLNGSIGRYGQIYPVLLRRLRPGVEKFELFVGSRRLKAAWKGNRTTIPAIIIDDISDSDMVVISLAENLHRQDMTPFEEASAILELCTKHQMTPKDVAKKIHRNVHWVNGRLKLLSVPEDVQKLLSHKKVRVSHVKILAALPKPKDQIRYARMVAKQNLGEEDLVTLIREEAAAKGIEPEVKKERPDNNGMFTPMRTALKVRRFARFLEKKVRLQLALEGPEIVKVRKALREVRRIIKDLLANSRRTQTVP
jgi:ParB family chromosome partitioning protein